MRAIWISLLLIACGEADPTSLDASKGGGSDSGRGGLTLDCDSYCNAINTACTATRKQYASVQNCLDACADLPLGALSDTSGNTLGCRVYHTTAAMTDPATHCVHAGPSGGGQCGASICEGFCSIAVSECPTQWQAGSCATNCGGLPSTPPYSTQSLGDTIECRLYH